jgi:hypothetical protein
MNTALQGCALGVVLVWGLIAQTPGKPDFSGTWQLDLERTRFGQVPQPKHLVIQFEHHEPQLRMITVATTAAGERRETLELTTDGKPQPFTLHGQPCTAAARWDQWSGARLVIEEICAGTTVNRRFMVGTKGKILTTVLTVKDNVGEKKAYEFFSRHEAQAH